MLALTATKRLQQNIPSQQLFFQKSQQSRSNVCQAYCKQLLIRVETIVRVLCNRQMCLESLNPGKTRKRVSLHVYPFFKKPYCMRTSPCSIDDDPLTQSAGVAAAACSPEEGRDGCVWPCSRALVSSMNPRSFSVGVSRPRRDRQSMNSVQGPDLRFGVPSSGPRASCKSMQH